jgi:hypothetical protein
MAYSSRLGLFVGVHGATRHSIKNAEYSIDHTTTKQPLPKNLFPFYKQKTKTKKNKNKKTTNTKN